MSRLRPLPAVADTKNGLTGPSRSPRTIDDRSRGRGRWVWAVITALIVSSIGFAFAISPSMQKSHANYDPHGVIVINSDAELVVQAIAEDWRGNGSALDPFVIEGYDIAAIGHDEGIYVGNTSSHLVIDGCYVHDATLACISLFNVTNVTVSRTECVNGERSIQVVSSGFVNMIGNNCTMAAEGIGISDSQWCAVVGNNCSGNLVGVSAQGCGNLSLRLNSAHGNIISGIRIISTTHFILTNNTCVGGQFGVQVMLSEHGSAINSTTVGSSDTGIYLSSCIACSVEGNRCSGHGSSGISVVDSPGCSVRDNDAWENGYGVRGLGCDDLEVRENDCRDNRVHGILVEDSGGCVVANNHCHGNGGDGVGMGGCHDGRAEANLCEGNGGSGLRCYDSERNHVRLNTCTDNGDCGIRCHGLVQGEVVLNNVSKSHRDGLYLTLSSDVNVSENTCSETDAGIRFSMCDSCSAFNNTITDSVLGVAASGSTGLVLRQNGMTDCGVFLEGPAPEHWSTHEIDMHNTVNGLHVLYLVSISGLKVTGTPGQVILADCIDITVDGLDLSNSTVGVALGFSNGVTVSNSTCSGGYIGVYGHSSSGLTVADSDCSRNSRSGVELSMCGACDLLRLVCEDNGEYGVRLNSSTGCDIVLCRLSGSSHGVSTEHTSSAGLVADNVISNCTTGVRAQSAERVEIESNEIRDCDYGILLADSPSMSMVANTLVGCGLYIESDLITGWSTHTIGSGNSVNGRALVYLVGASGATLPASSGQVVLAGCSWITASSMDLSESTVGVLAGYSNHITVIGCNLSDNQLGAEFANCADCSVLSNTISDCALEGVRLRGSSDNVVEDNLVLRCDIGIRVCEGLLPSTGNLVSGNNASYCTHGVMVSSSPETTVERNVLLSDLACGVMVGMSNHTVVRNNTCNGSGDMAVSVWGSEGCTISNNSCSMNHRGIYLWSSVRCNISGNVLYGSEEYGVRLDSASKNNAVWDNVFAYNNGTTESYDPLRAQACDDGIGNRWNNSDTLGGLGNYWHDLTAPDDDLDGVVDVPYNVSGTAKAKDHRPLANTSVSIEQIPELGPLPVAACLGLLMLCPDRRKWD